MLDHRPRWLLPKSSIANVVVPVVTQTLTLNHRDPGLEFQVWVHG